VRLNHTVKETSLRFLQAEVEATMLAETKECLLQPDE
jgi:hypothetical protein